MGPHGLVTSEFLTEKERAVQDGTDKEVGRRNLAMNLSLPAEELLRLRDFAVFVGRPMSWIVRDALRLYIDRMESDPPAWAARSTPGALDTGSSPPPELRGAGRPPGARDLRPRTRRKTAGRTK